MFESYLFFIIGGVETFFDHYGRNGLASDAHAHFRAEGSVDTLRLKQAKMRFQYLSPESRLREKRQMLLDCENVLRGAMEWKITEKRHSLGIFLERYKGLSPLGKLNQGYSFVADKKGCAMKSVSQASPGELLDISVTDGVIEARITGTRKEKWDI